MNPFRIATRIKKLLNTNTIVVYTMGKVGSTSVEKSLPNTFHTHTLYGNPPSKPAQIRRFGKLKFILRRFTVYPAKRILLRLNKEIKIVTFYRDSKDRNPSMFMQDLPFWLSAYISDNNVAIREEDPDLLLTAYKDSFPHDYPSFWIRHELGKFTGIDYHELSLGSKNFRIIKNGRYSVFIGRTESLDDCLPALSDFLGIQIKDKMQRTNRGEAKWYASIYKDFLRKISNDSSISFDNEFRKSNGYIP